MRATHLLAAAALLLSCNSGGQDSATAQAAAAGSQRFLLYGCGISVLLPTKPKLEANWKGPPPETFRYVEYVARVEERVFRITCSLGNPQKASPADLLQGNHEYAVNQLRASAPKVVERARDVDHIETVIHGKFATTVRRTQVLPNGDLFGLTVSPIAHRNEPAVAAFLDGMRVEPDAAEMPPPKPTIASSAASDAGAAPSARPTLQRYRLPGCGGASVPFPKKPPSGRPTQLPSLEPFPSVLPRPVYIYHARAEGKSFTILCVMGSPSDVPPGEMLEKVHEAILSSAPGKAKPKQLSRDRSHIESSIALDQGIFVTRTQVRDDDTSFVLEVGPVTSRDEALAKEFLDGLRFEP